MNTMASPKLEVACFNVEAAMLAKEAGADRLELCDNAKEGGTTPSIHMILSVIPNQRYDYVLRGVERVPIHAMIRPHGGNFVYSNEEYMKMRLWITRYREHVEGFVFGVLGEDSKIDIARNRKLISIAKGIPCTLHRAFDDTPDLQEALEDAISCGFQTVLSSGGRKTAEEGVENLSMLVRQAGDRITVMPGGGVRSGNIRYLKQKTGAKFYHSAAKEDSEDEHPSTEQIEAMKQALCPEEAKL